MFDPDKYDNTNSQNNTGNEKPGSFIAKRYDIIDYLNRMKPIIESECTSLENQIKKNPTSKAVSPFNEKLDGWSRILNGLKIVNKMYMGKS